MLYTQFEPPTMSLKELQSMLEDVKKDGASFVGGAKAKTGGRKTGGRGKQSSAMEGPNAQCHAFDGILYHAKNKSLYGGQENFQGGAMSGGFLGMLAPIAASLAPMVVGSVIKAFKGSGVSGGSVGNPFDPHTVKVVTGGVAHAMVPLLGEVASRMTHRGRGGMVTGGQQNFQGGYTKLLNIPDFWKGKKKGGMLTGGMLTGGQDNFAGAGRRKYDHLTADEVAVLDKFKKGIESGRRGKSGRPRMDKSVKSANARKRASTNPWLRHVAEVRAENPGMAYKDVLVLAKQSY
jgi:hypothetical protein